MTAQVAVLNKTAVALATDSAVTSQHKIYNSVNKLFRLSDHYPVGIMIYGNAEMMGLPWESIIKVYRTKLGKTSQKQLSKYGEDFIRYIKSQHSIFPETERANYVARITFGFLGELIDRIEAIRDSNPSNLNEALKAYLENHLSGLCTRVDELDDLPANYRSDIRSRHADGIKNYAKAALSQIQITVSPENEELITRWCIECLCRQHFTDHSGIVIAGFGEDELFPSLVEYEIEGFAGSDFLKYRKKQESGIKFDNSAQITPFAQKEMVESFMEGVHPQFFDHFESFLRNVIENFEAEILKGIAAYSNVDVGAFEKKLKKSTRAIFSELDKEIERDQRENHIQPVLDVVELLPKDELAAMAESLVNLTILKRKMSTDQETVGGPINVAVISKGDGFIWIKRKHYFTRDLNPRYVMQSATEKP